MTLEDAVKLFLEIEKKLDLYNFTVHNEKVWFYFRMNLFYKICMNNDIYQIPHESQKKIKNFSNLLISLLKSIFLYNPQVIDNHKTHIVFSHNRKVKYNGQFIDIYTDFKNIENCYIFEKPFMGQHKRSKKGLIYFLDAILVAKEISQYKRLKFNQNEKNIIKKIHKEFKDNFNFNFDLEKYVKRQTLKFMTGLNYYAKIFKKIKPKAIYCVESYSFNYDIISAARNYSIPTIEIQHGTISKYHIGYNFSDYCQLTGLADKMLCWGKFWKDNFPTTHYKNKMILDKFEYLHIQKNGICVNKNKMNVLIVSQSAIGEKLIKEIYMDKSLIQRYTIFYKPHPSEINLYQNYKYFDELNQYEQFKICQNENLYKLFSICEFQIGVFSTALYEGYVFGCKTIILDLPGASYMKNFISYPGVQLKDKSFSEVINKLNEEEIFYNVKSDFFGS